MLYGIYVAFALMFFALQLILCFKAKKLTTRFIPALIILAGYLIALLSAEGYFGGGTGFIDDGTFAGVIIVIGMSCAAVGDAIAWLIYALMHKKRKSK